MATNVWTPYNHVPTQAISVIFPNHGMQLLDNLVHYFGVTALTYCFAIRSYNENLLSVRGWWQLTWPRLTILLTFFFSWVFVLATGILVNGIGMSYTPMACRMGIYACIIFYALTKLLIYSFLAEKVYVVWAPGNNTQPRFKSTVYKVCLAVMSGYIGIFITMVIGQISEFRNDGVCIIGLKPFASVTLLAYDLFLNVFLTSMFIYPLARHASLINPKLKAVAARTLVAAMAALTTSSVNVAILTAMHGRQLGWVCLASCCTDVTLNALVLFWVTSRGTSTKQTPSHGGVAPLSPNNPVSLSGKHSQSDPDKYTSRRAQSHVFDSQYRAQGGTRDCDAGDEQVDVHRSDTQRVKGVSGWLGRLRSTKEDEATSMQVEVTVLTEMEMDEIPEHKFERASQLTEEPDLDPAKSSRLSSTTT